MFSYWNSSAYRSRKTCCSDISASRQRSEPLQRRHLMRHRLLTSISILAVTAILPAAGQNPAPKKVTAKVASSATVTTPRTPWGGPDVQGGSKDAPRQA